MAIFFAILFGIPNKPVRLPTGADKPGLVEPLLVISLGRGFLLQLGHKVLLGHHNTIYYTNYQFYTISQRLTHVI